MTTGRFLKKPVKKIEPGDKGAVLKNQWSSRIPNARTIPRRIVNPRGNRKGK